MCVWSLIYILIRLINKTYKCLGSRSVIFAKYRICTVWVVNPVQILYSEIYHLLSDNSVRELQVTVCNCGTEETLFTFPDNDDGELFSCNYPAKTVLTTSLSIILQWQQALCRIRCQHTVNTKTVHFVLSIKRQKPAGLQQTAEHKQVFGRWRDRPLLEKLTETRGEKKR